MKLKWTKKEYSGGYFYAIKEFDLYVSIHVQNGSKNCTLSISCPVLSLQEIYLASPSDAKVCADLLLKPYLQEAA